MGGQSRKNNNRPALQVAGMYGKGLLSAAFLTGAAALCWHGKNDLSDHWEKAMNPTPEMRERIHQNCPPDIEKATCESRVLESYKNQLERTGAIMGGITVALLALGLGAGNACNEDRKRLKHTCPRGPRMDA